MIKLNKIPQYLKDLVTMSKEDIYLRDPLLVSDYWKLKAKNSLIKLYRRHNVNNTLPLLTPRSLLKYNRMVKDYEKSLKELDSYPAIQANKKYYRNINLARLGIGIPFAYILLKKLRDNDDNYYQ